MKTLFDLAKGIDVLRESVGLDIHSLILQTHIQGIWDEIKKYGWPSQEVILLERISYCIYNDLNKNPGKWVGVEKMGKMLHGNSDVPSNPVSVINKIFMYRFNNEVGVRILDAHLTAAAIGRVVVKKENLGGEWVRRVVLTTKAGDIHLTTWDE